MTSIAAGTAGVPAEWARLAAAKPTDGRPAMDADMVQACTQFITGNMTERRVEEKMRGKLGPMMGGVTEARLALAEQLRAAAEGTGDADLRGGGANGLFFRVNPKLGGGGGAAAGASVKPFMRLVQKAVRAGKLDADTISAALAKVTPDAVREIVKEAQQKATKRPRKTKAASSTLQAAFVEALRRELNALLYPTKRWDVEFCDKLPQKVNVDEGVVLANEDVMTAFRSHNERSTDCATVRERKSRTLSKARDMSAGVYDQLFEYMNRTNQRSLFFSPTVEGKKQRVFLRLKLRDAKRGKAPTLTWVKEQVGDAIADEEALRTNFMEGGADAVAAFRATISESLEPQIKALEEAVVAPAKVILAVDMGRAATELSGGGSGGGGGGAAAAPRRVYENVTLQ